MKLYAWDIKKLRGESTETGEANQKHSVCKKEYLKIKMETSRKKPW